MNALKKYINIFGLAFVLARVLIVIPLVLTLMSPRAALSADNWTETGSLNEGRHNHTATLLANGKVLVVGGVYKEDINTDQVFLSSAELYDPTSGSWSTTGSMSTSREGHTATLLANGKVLVVGGMPGGSGGSYGYALDSAELYDPGTGIWSSTGSMGTARAYHTATLLTNGQVLVAAGWNNSDGMLEGAELYNPDTVAFTATWSLNVARDNFHTLRLADGKVLVVGGYAGGSLDSAELYDPVSKTLEPHRFPWGGSSPEQRHSS
jgi:hypothetical protein